MHSGVSSPASSRDEAYALALAELQAAHPGVTFALQEETTGGGIHGPWVFWIVPAARDRSAQVPGLGPVLVEYMSARVEYLRPQSKPLKAIVAEWEIAKYGHPQR
ncbi:MAG TPA: hypothetical protein VMJ10_32340 [Kofleriaceae bacterium]|nr:hypothetical protein [Kofleriaceae bacterium]